MKYFLISFLCFCNLIYTQVFDYKEYCDDNVYIINYNRVNQKSEDEYLLAKVCTQKFPVGLRVGMGYSHHFHKGNFHDWYNNNRNFNFHATINYKKWLFTFEADDSYKRTTYQETLNGFLIPERIEIGHENINVNFGRVFEFKHKIMLEPFLGVNFRSIKFHDYYFEEAEEEEINIKRIRLSPTLTAGVRLNKYFTAGKTEIVWYNTFKFFPSQNLNSFSNNYQIDFWSFSSGIAIHFLTDMYKIKKTTSHE